MVVIFFNALDEVCLGLLALGGGEQVKGKRHAVGGLELTLDLTIGFDKGLLEVGTDVLELFVVFGGIVYLAEGHRHLRHQAGGVGMVSG